MKKKRRPRPDQTMELGRAKAKAVLGPEIQNKIGQQLRAMYSDVVSEGVPDRFAELLQQLDAQDKAKERK